MNPESLIDALRTEESDRLIFNEIDGDLFVSNTYWMLRAGRQFVDLLAAFNLPAEPMSCSLGWTLRRTDKAPADFAGLWVGALKAEMTPLTRLRLGGNDVYARLTQSQRRVGYYRTDGLTLALDEQKVDLIQRLCAVDGWRASANQLSPVVGYDGRDKPSALLMPVRVSTDEDPADILDPLPELVEMAS